MASVPKNPTMSPGDSTARHNSPPPPGLRQRPLSRAATFAEPSMPLNRRRSSMFSESPSDTRKSFRSSTDNLLLPKVLASSDLEETEETSHWHSLPLGLALLPAAGGLFFKDGNAIITDVTLLALAAIFMNWALRMPWEWYRAAQSAIIVDDRTPSVFTPIEEENEKQLEQTENVNGETPSPGKTVHESNNEPAVDNEKLAAQQELRIHEILALTSCFVFPALAAWLLHAIRSQLSRPSEGLVSNYNLTIFLLVAEIRPLSHLIKMIQHRTFFLRRKVNIEALQNHARESDEGKLDAVYSRLEELESHMTNGSAPTETGMVEPSEALTTKAYTQASSEIRKSVQPELDALNRAMRRYEKRSTISAVQIESRLQDLETRLKDVVVLAAAAQRSTERQPKNYIFTLTNWICAAVVIPLQSAKYFLTIPSRVLSSVMSVVLSYVPGTAKTRKPKDPRANRRSLKTTTQDREKRVKLPS